MNIGELLAKELDRQTEELQAEIERLRAALGFYARPTAYYGPNQFNDGSDPYTPKDASYFLDVTRDGGEIARHALNQQITEIDPIEEVQMKDFNSPEEAIAAAKEAIDKHNLMLKRIRASKKSQRTRKAMRLARGK